MGLAIFQSLPPEIGCYYYSQARFAPLISLQVIQWGQMFSCRAEWELWNENPLLALRYNRGPPPPMWSHASRSCGISTPASDWKEEQDVRFLWCWTEDIQLKEQSSQSFFKGDRRKCVYYILNLVSQYKILFVFDALCWNNGNFSFDFPVVGSELELKRLILWPLSDRNPHGLPKSGNQGASKVIIQTDMHHNLFILQKSLLLYIEFQRSGWSVITCTADGSSSPGVPNSRPWGKVSCSY